MKGTNSEYGKLARVLHWSSAALITTLIILGLYMKRLAGNDSKVILYRVHILLGILTGIVILLRVVWIFVDTRPSPPPALSGIKKALFRYNHIGLYTLLVLMIISGLGTLLTSSLQDILDRGAAGEIREDLDKVLAAKNHMLFAFVTIFLISMHLVGVISHHVREEKILWRMGMGERPTE